MLLCGNLSLVGFCVMSLKIEKISEKNQVLVFSVVANLLGSFDLFAGLQGSCTLLFYFTENFTKNLVLYPLKYF